ncbi:protein scabrous-like [Trichogramma pretiosum]|uniref:protein scabrous-like n=1 Tax=Trichogramma pretiosum TaxID=7493 RepID=UPI0006C98D72|nr:protein scabrous-like [Trichogramma pretiosum]
MKLVSVMLLLLRAAMIGTIVVVDGAEFQRVVSAASSGSHDLIGSEDELASTVKLLQEQVAALLVHRQEDYDALEASLKRTMEKNTELIVLKNEIKQLRKEVIYLRQNSALPVSGNNIDAGAAAAGGGGGSDISSGSNKNERLRLRWLADAVQELRAELAEVLRANNASEDMAERAKSRAEMELLRADYAGLGHVARKLEGRMDRMEASFAGIRVDEEDRTDRIDDFASQLTALQTELKSYKRELQLVTKKNQKPQVVTAADIKEEKEEDDSREILKNEIFQPSSSEDDVPTLHHTRHVYSRLPTAVRRLEARLSKLERRANVNAKKSHRRRQRVLQRVVYEPEDYQQMFHRLNLLEAMSSRVNDKLRNVSETARVSNEFGQSVVHMFESLSSLEERLVANQSLTKRELVRLDVQQQQQSADLSVVRADLGNLQKAVQALSVSASKLQERADSQQTSLEELRDFDLKQVKAGVDVARVENLTRELEHVEDEYRLMVDALPGNCQEKEGLTLLAPGPGAPLLAACRKGWIVVGRRVDGTVDFDRSWNDYAQGFGSPMNEFWAGNEALHRLSRDNCTRLRVELNDIEGNYWVANYEDFSVDSEDNGYRLRVGGYSGNATDAMDYQNNMRFSAKDRDLDISSTDCAANYHGGWWFSHCQHANLNGRYSLGLTWYRTDVNQWMAVASAELSVQRKQQCL